MNDKIDIIIPWVDGNDPLWRAQKDKYDTKHEVSDVRFESWDNLQYVFRGIEKYMPWIHKVFFITWGHIPEWLNSSYEKLVIVKHEDYIPQEFLPTFNSNTIEMNYFRIEELSENFILFNDDLFPLQPVPEEYYFRNNLPCEEAVETHFILKTDNIAALSFQMIYACVNNMVLINKNFDKRTVIKENYKKWFSPVYGERLSHNENLKYWNHFESFVYPHEAMPMKKSVLKEIWDKEPEMLRKASFNKFRSHTDVTQRLITMWQICLGKFEPHKFMGKMFLLDKGNYQEAVEAIDYQKYPVICLNEMNTEDFGEIKMAVNKSFNKLFPEKSKFELY